MASWNRGERPQPPFLIFDMETIPDLPLLYQCYAPDLHGPDFCPVTQWNSMELLSQIQNHTQITFPPPLVQSIVSICAVFVHPQTHNIMDGFKRTIQKVNSYEAFLEQEKELLKEFWDFCLKYENFVDESGETPSFEYGGRIGKKLPLTFCGYNITGFDLPVLELRSLKHFITCPIDAYAKTLGIGSYRYKYASDKVFDLLNYIFNYDNRNAKGGLDALAKALGLTGKMEGMDGRQVAAAYFQQEASNLIEEYCAIDVLITYGVFLAVQKFRGILNEESWVECRRWFYTWLQKEGKPESYVVLAQNSTAFFKGI